MTFWAETFKQVFNPNVKIQIEGKGSTTAPPALISGTAQLGPMSRPMKGTEIDTFEKKFGYKPTRIRTAVDALAVFVNKDNPIKCLTTAQVDAIFSKSRRAGYKQNIQTWGQLGYHSKPLGLLDINGFYRKLGDFLDHLVEERFVRAQHRAMLQLSESPAELLQALRDWQPSAAPKWVDRAPD